MSNNEILTTLVNIATKDMAVSGTSTPDKTSNEQFTFRAKVIIADLKSVVGERLDDITSAINGYKTALSEGTGATVVDFEQLATAVDKESTLPRHVYKDLKDALVTASTRLEKTGSTPDVARNLAIGKLGEIIEDAIKHPEQYKQETSR